MSSSRTDNLAPGYSSHPASRSHSQTRSGSPSTNNSPVESANPPSRPPFGFPGTMSSTGKMPGNPRSGAGSPSHDVSTSSRLFSKRAREIQAQEGVPGLPLNLWGGPPTSGNSTPLRENIPESPTDGFPDFVQLPTPESLNQPRRARAGTVPSRFSPGGAGSGPLGAPGLAVKSARVTPSQSPFHNSPSPGLEPVDHPAGGSTLLSRLRAGSMPQRSQLAPLPGTSSPFGPSIFSSWNPTGLGRDRGSTLASIASVGSNGPSSPSQSQISKEGAGDSDVHMRTLDYLGLAETPQQPRAQLATPYMPSMAYAKQANRFRSYSVNNKDKYADEYDDYGDDQIGADGMPLDSQYVADVAALQNRLAATNAAIHSHNLAVQALVNQTRPRARTAGVLDMSRGPLGRPYMSAGPADISNAASSDLHMQEKRDFDDLPQAVASLNLGGSSSRTAGLLGADEQGLDGPTSALWLGNVPTSTTTSTLVEMFKSHGNILSARVLTHKSCGFVNFERVESAVTAKALMNGKEIFPGAGPIRINFAKPASGSNTPGHDSMYPSPSPDPFVKTPDNGAQGTQANRSDEVLSASSQGVTDLHILSFEETVPEIAKLAPLIDATPAEVEQIRKHLQAAVSFTNHISEIPPVREPTHARVHDAPKLREIRKRMESTMSEHDIENVAREMLPEIAELSSDYLGNTVVQKLFERCSDPVRDLMLAEIAPHLAEIGVHKNGTWAAQKIIDVCKTPQQMTLIAKSVHPYTVPLFMDQYGNYVIQCCLKYGPPYSDFIYETMVSKLWEVGQGRFSARAMRACLESHHAPKALLQMLACAIALRSAQLSTDHNSALLMTWLIDSCIFPNRRTVTAPQMVKSMAYLCLNKHAHGSLLKIANQRAEPEARQTLLNGLFFSPNDQVMEAVLKDPSGGGPQLVFKMLTLPGYDEPFRGRIVEHLKDVLLKVKPAPHGFIKRIMDEIGLSSRPNRETNPHAESGRRSAQKHGNANGHGQAPNGGKNHFGSMAPGAQQPGYDMGFASQAGDAADPSMPTAFSAPGQAGLMYGGSSGPMPPAMSMAPQLSYQQPMMGRPGPQMGFSYGPMQSGYTPYGGMNPSMDQFRQANMPNGSPIQPPATHMAPQMPGAQPGYAPPGFGIGMTSYPYGGMPNMAYTHQEQPNNRRGRR